MDASVRQAPASRARRRRWSTSARACGRQVHRAPAGRRSLDLGGEPVGASNGDGGREGRCRAPCAAGSARARWQNRDHDQGGEHARGGVPDVVITSSRRRTPTAVSMPSVNAEIWLRVARARSRPGRRAPSMSDACEVHSAASPATPKPRHSQLALAVVDPQRRDEQDERRERDARLWRVPSTRSRGVGARAQAGAGRGRAREDAEAEAAADHAPVHLVERAAEERDDGDGAETHRPADQRPAHQRAEVHRRPSVAPVSG